MPWWAWLLIGILTGGLGLYFGLWLFFKTYLRDQL